MSKVSKKMKLFLDQISTVCWNNGFKISPDGDEICIYKGMTKYNNFDSVNLYEIDDDGNTEFIEYDENDTDYKPSIIEIKIPKGYMNVSVGSYSFSADTNDSANWDEIVFPLPLGNWELKGYNDDNTIVYLIDKTIK